MTQNEYEQLIANASDAESIREISKRFFVANQVIERAYEGTESETVLKIPRVGEQIGAPEPALSPLDASQLMRKAIHMPDGTIRMIDAYSLSGLDNLELFLTGKIS